MVEREHSPSDDLEPRIGSVAAQAPIQPPVSWQQRLLDSTTVVSWASVLLLLMVWTLATNVGWLKPSQLPTPQAMVSTLGDALTKGYDGVPLWQHVGYSLMRALGGLSIGVLTGIPVGLVMGYFRRANAALMPILSFVRPVPAIAFIPLVILYLGIGEPAKVLVVWIPAFLYMVLNTSSGVRSVPENAVLAGLNLGLSQWTFFYRIILPYSMPFIINGLKTALALSWSVMVAAELIGARAGLGFMVLDASIFYRIPYVYLGIAIIGLIGLLMELSVGLIEKRSLHWVKQR